MLDKVQFVIPGPPERKRRTQIMARVIYPKGGGKPRALVQAVTPKETRDAEARIAKIARKAMAGHPPFTSAIRITVVAIFPIPPSWPKRVQAAAATGRLFHTSVPDADNVLKLVSDAMNGTVYVDDAQAAETLVRKRFGPNPEVRVTVEALEQPILTPADSRRAQDQAEGRHRAQTNAPAPERASPGKIEAYDLFGGGRDGPR